MNFSLGIFGKNLLKCFFYAFYGREEGFFAFRFRKL